MELQDYLEDPEFIRMAAEASNEAQSELVDRVKRGKMQDSVD